MRWYWGLLALIGGAGAGAAIGAAVHQEDRKMGAAGGAAAGLLLVGVAGVGATVSSETRAAGLTATLPVAALVVAGVVANASSPQAS
ncbi:MAG: hypothetical protein KGI71_04755 [Patescibacteria group bacterium]|nr:hypothetical protein [Patescibacteria group bacterium]